MSITRAAIAALLLMAMASAACAAGDGVETQDIVADIPWTAPETSTYVIRHGSEDQGEATLSVEREGANFRFTQRFRDDEANSDESTVLADGVTLKPLSMTRTIVNKEERIVAEAAYEAEVVRIKQSNFRPPGATTPDSTRGNPLRLPEHGYDNHSSLFLWRTIRFERGYTVTYTTIHSNVRQKENITLRVKEQKRVQTPAGEFDAWHVRIETEDGTQNAWFATTAEHRLLVYDNGDIVLLLKEYS